MDDDDYNVPDLKSLTTYELEESVICLDVARDHEAIAAGTIDDEVVVLDTDLKLKHKLSGHEGGTNSLGFASDNVLVSAGEDGKARVWNASTGSCIAELPCEGLDADKTPDGHSVSHISIDPSGKLALCAAGKTVHLLDLAAEDKEAARKVYPPVPGGVVECTSFVRSDKVLVSYYGGITLWGTDPAEDGIELEYGSAVHAVAGTPDITWMVGGCMDNCVHIWHVKQVVDDGEGFHLEELSCGGYSHKVTLVDFDRSKRYLASAGGTRNTVWDFSGEGPANSTPTVTIGHTKPITAQAWQQDGAGLLATGSKDGRIMVFNVHDYLDGMPNMCLPVAMADAGSDSPVTCIKWAAGGRLYSGHEDGKVCSWQLPEGLELINVPNEQTAADSHLLESKSPA